MAEYIPFPIGSFSDYFSHMSAGRKERTECLLLGMDHVRNNREWISARLEENGAEWMVFGGSTGRIYRHGAMVDYPTEEELMKIGESSGEVAMVFPLSPESVG